MADETDRPAANDLFRRNAEERLGTPAGQPAGDVEASRQMRDGQFRVFVEQSPVSIAVVEMDGTIAYVNSRAVETFGYRHEDIPVMDRWWEQAYPDESYRMEVQARWTGALEKAMTHGHEIERDEYRVTCKDGTVKTTAIFGVVVGNQVCVMFEDITARKQREEQKALESETRFRTMFTEAPLGVALSDSLTGHIYEVNRRFAEIAGRSVAEMRTLDWMSITHPDDLQEDLDNMARLNAGEIPGFKMNKRYRRPDGSDVWISMAIAKVTQSDGGHPQHLCMIEDITERRRVEEALRAGSARVHLLAHALQGSDECISITDTEDHLLYVNQAFLRTYEYREDEVIGQHISMFRSARTPEDVQHQILPATLEGGWQGELWNRTKAGREFPIWLMTSAVFNDAGQRIALVGIARDVTERKEAEKALRESETRYRRLVDAVPGVLYAYSDTRAGIYYSPQVELMLGYTADYLREHPTQWHDSIHPDDLPAVDRAVRESPRARRLEIEYRIRHADGQWRVFLDTSVAIRSDASGETVIEGLAQDITDRKRAEEEKAKLEAQLQQAQKLESVGRLAGGVAHDFNNMLAVILGHGELALDHVDASHPVHRHLLQIEKAAGHSAELTSQLLAFARRQTIAPKVLDLNERVTAMLKMLQRLIGEDITLHWNQETDLWPVKIDPTQVDQLLTNLCINARDAITGVGELTIQTRNTTLDAAAEAAPGDYVVLAVSDTGAGMSPETLAHLFEPFFTTKELGRGTGLGLATVHGIAGQNGGFVTAASQLGVGTTFTVYLPRHVGMTVEALAPAAQDAPHARGETVLLVEDEPGILELATEMLEGQGYTVLDAGTPEEALRLAREHAGEIHLLMTDVVMPAMNGRDLVTQVATVRPRVKSLFMSGYTADVIAGRGVLAADVHFIQKPFTRQALAVKVRQVLDAE